MKSVESRVPTASVEPETTPTIRVLVVGRHKLERDALALLVATDASITVVSDGDDVADAFEHASGTPPDVVLVDGDDLAEQAQEVLDRVRRLAGGARTLVLTASADRDFAGRLVLAGARGIVSKDRPGEHLLNAIRKVHAGELWIDRATSAQIIADMAGRRVREAGDPERAKIASLTPREREVITLVAQGRSNKAIAEHMAISDNTVRHHLTSIFSKLEIADRLALVVYTYHHRIG